MEEKLKPYAAVVIARIRDENGHSSTIVQPLPLMAKNDEHAMEVGRAIAGVMIPMAYQVDVGALAFPPELLEQIKKLFDL